MHAMKKLREYQSIFFLHQNKFIFLLHPSWFFEVPSGCDGVFPTLRSTIASRLGASSSPASPIQLLANSWENSKGWLECLASAIHLGDAHEAPGSWLWPSPAIVTPGDEPADGSSFSPSLFSLFFPSFLPSPPSHLRVSATLSNKLINFFLKEGLWMSF